MTILINLYNLTSGGGLTIGVGLLEELWDRPKDGITYYLLVPKIREYTECNRGGRSDIHLIQLPSFYTQSIGRLFTERKIARVAKELNVERILNLTNYPIPTSIPQTLLIHWPYLVYDDALLWTKMHFIRRLKRKLAKHRIASNLKFADKIVVQTDVMKQRFLKKFPQNSKEVDIIPAFHNFNSKDKLTSVKAKKNKHLLFVSKHYEHKNHELLLPLAQLMKEKHMLWKIDITISNEAYAKLGLNNYSDVISNLGEVSPKELESIIGNYDGLFLPSLVETFGIPYLEAMHFKLPIYTSNLDFAKAVCGDYASYFDPYDPESVIETLENSMEVHNRIVPTFPDRKEVVNRLLRMNVE